jgi:SanA protein
VLITIVVAAVSPFALRVITAAIYRYRTYNPETVPARSVAIVFGARVYRNGRPSAMLADRVATAVDLYSAGKVNVLLMTGDNSTPYYDEPGAMRDYAISLGVPSEAIVIDGAGTRTYDSCYRASAIYDVQDAILVTQNFHLDRALLTCNGLGIDAVGVSADYQRPWGYSRVSLSYSRLRELPATLLAFLDLIRRPLPTLGAAMPIRIPVDTQ